LADAEGEAIDGGVLTAFRFKTLPTQEFLVHEQVSMTGISVTTKHENGGERAHNGIRHCAIKLG
jgi:peptidyl-tRNA hydrolase